VRGIKRYEHYLYYDGDGISYKYDKELPEGEWVRYNDISDLIANQIAGRCKDCSVPKKLIDGNKFIYDCEYSRFYYCEENNYCDRFIPRGKN
jgi:hypothetical protein